MKYFLLTFIFCFGLIQKNAFGFECYSTGFRKLTEKFSPTMADDIPHQVQCEEDIKGITENVKKGIIPMTSNAPLRCFSLDYQLEDSSKTRRIKGCLPQGSCNMMKTFFKAWLATENNEVQENSLICNECNTNLCNTNRARSGSIPVYLSGLLIVTVLMYFYY